MLKKIKWTVKEKKTGIELNFFIKVRRMGLAHQRLIYFCFFISFH
jgi:hypothetical protein